MSEFGYQDHEADAVVLPQSVIRHLPSALLGDFGGRLTVRGSQSAAPFPVRAGPAYSSRSRRCLGRILHPGE